MENNIRSILPGSMREVFDSIAKQGALGASNHTVMVGDMIEAVVQGGEDEQRPTDQVIDEILVVAGFFIATGGEASQAVSNAILLMTYNIRSHAGMDLKEAAPLTLKTKNSYARTAAEAVRQCVAHGVRLAETMETIFVYDCSSTVEELPRGLKGNGKRYTVYIAESRVIDGGRPSAKACLESGHKIKLIPEASTMYHPRDYHGVFMGAETFYPDGTGSNTTGSDITGLMCRYYRVPLYFSTPLIKPDIRPVFDGGKKLVYDDLKEKLTANWGEDLDREFADSITPELVGVEPGFIRGFVTEKGVIPSGQTYGISMEYNRNLRRVQDEKKEKMRMNCLGRDSKIVLSMIQPEPLPDSYRHAGVGIREIVDMALRETEMVMESHFDGIIVQNMNDTPIEQESSPEAIVHTTRTSYEIRKRFPELLMGILMNWDGVAGLSVADAVEADSVRVERLFTGASVTSTGVLQAQCVDIANLRKRTGSKASVYADVRKVHGIPLGRKPVGDAAWECVHEAFADGLFMPDKSVDESIRMTKGARERAGDVSIFLDGGATGDNIHELMQYSDGVSVVTWIKNGDMKNPIDPEWAEVFVSEVKRKSQNGTLNNCK